MAKQIEDINYNFDEVIKVLNARREIMLTQVRGLVEKLRESLADDITQAEIKRDEEGDLLNKIRSL